VNRDGWPDMTPPDVNTFSVRGQNGYAVATISGELGIARVPALREVLLSLLGAQTNRIIIDLSRVTCCDASGLAVLVGVGRRAWLLGGVLRLAAPTPPVAAVLHLTGLDVHFETFATVSAATAPSHLGIPDASLQRRVPMSQLSTRPLASQVNRLRPDPVPQDLGRPPGPPAPLPPPTTTMLHRRGSGHNDAPSSW